MPRGKGKNFAYERRHIDWISGQLKAGTGRGAVVTGFMQQFGREPNFPSQRKSVNVFVRRNFPEGMNPEESAQSFWQRTPKARMSRIATLIWGKRTPEERSAILKKSAQTLGEEGAAKVKVAVWASKTDKEKEQWTRNRSKALEGKRSSIAVKMWKDMTQQERDERVKGISRGLQDYYARLRNANINELEENGISDGVGYEKIYRKKAPRRGPKPRNVVRNYARRNVKADRKNPAYHAMENERSERVWAALKVLEPFEARVVESHFGLLDGYRPINAVLLSREMGIPRSEAREMLSKTLRTALEKLSRQEILQDL